jgi:hypothetical protein
MNRRRDVEWGSVMFISSIREVMVPEIEERARNAR